MSNRKNLANAILALGVSTSDTTWVLEAGYGDEMPAVPFELTATPFGQLSTMGNSEIVRVTARSTDTLTVVRAQKGTTAKAFLAGAVVSNGISTDDVVGIEVNITTARTTAAKVGTTADGNYVPVYGDKINATFTLGVAVNTPTLNIDGSGAKNIRLGNTNVSTGSLNTAASSVTIPMWFDGTYWQLYGSYVADTNTTYATMTTAEVDAGTSSTTRTITGVIAKYIIDKAVAAVQALTNWVTTAMLQNGSVTSDKIDWETLKSKTVRNSSSFNTSSTTMTDKVTTTLDKGVYIVIASVIFANDNLKANGECNITVAYGGSYTPGSTTYLPNLDYTSTENVQMNTIEITSDGTAVKLQTSVNWPARGTYRTAANAASMTFIRIG